MSLVCTVGDQFPLGNEAVSKGHEDTHRGELPFGLRLATSLRARSDRSKDTLRYDEERQLSTVWRGQSWVPAITMDSPLTVQSTGELGNPNYDEIFDKN